jgi:hypothetical protein
MSDDGSRIFFSTADPLVPEDINNHTDIYEWHNGDVGLITDGVTIPPIASREDKLLDVSADGSEVLFSTDAALTPGLHDTSNQAYVAALGPAPQNDTSTTPPCDPEQCQGLPSVAPAFDEPASLTLTSFGNLKSVTSTKLSKHLTKVQKLKRALKACKAWHKKGQRKKCEVSARRRFGKTGGSK